MSNLTLSDLAAGLEKFGDRYSALDVFTHDVQGLEQLLDGQPYSGFSESNGIVKHETNVFSFSHGNQRYRFVVFPEHGVVRVTRNGGVRSETMAGAALGTAVGGVVGAAVSRPQDQEIAALAGMALGLLMGGVIGATVADSNAPRRVFALRFDAEKKQWRAYDGGLIRWMKERLARPEFT